MKKQEFLKLIANAEEYSKELDKWSEFGINLFELPIAEITWEFLNIALESMFTEEGVDWINWWLFEKSGREDIQIYDENKNVIPTDTIEDLWYLVKNYRKYE